jgi:hypothetical protein
MEVIDLIIEVVDLTVDVKYCAICLNILGQGQGYVLRMFIFITYGYI